MRVRGKRSESEGREVSGMRIRDWGRETVFEYGEWRGVGRSGGPVRLPR